MKLAKGSHAPLYLWLTPNHPASFWCGFLSPFPLLWYPLMQLLPILFIVPSFYQHSQESIKALSHNIMWYLNNCTCLLFPTGMCSDNSWEFVPVALQIFSKSIASLFPPQLPKIYLCYLFPLRVHPVIHCARNSTLPVIWLSWLLQVFTHLCHCLHLGDDNRHG